MIDEETVREMVRRVVFRTLGLVRSPERSQARPLVTESDVRDLPPGATLPLPPGALITPLARQVALERRISLKGADMDPPGSAADQQAALHRSAEAQTRAVAIGADHGGYELKEILKQYLDEQGYSVVDCGTDSTGSVDYPDFAFAVARLVAQGRAWRGIVVDGAGIGSCMAANKVPGVRAAMCYDHATAVNSREHNDANVLTLGASLIGSALAQQIVKTWLDTLSGGGRHARRVAKIMDIERRYLRQAAGD